MGEDKDSHLLDNVTSCDPLGTEVFPLALSFVLGEQKQIETL